MMISATFDRFDIKEAHYLFWSEHHQGMFSEGYSKLCKALSNFSPSPLLCWESLSDNAKDIYRNLCERESEQCEYDSLKYLLEKNDWDTDDDCVSWFVDNYNDAKEDLCNYQTSDFINLDMCYTSSLLSFYRENEESILNWCDQLCEAYGYTSRLQLLEGQTVEDPDDFATGLVNAAMTYLGSELFLLVEDNA
jgi:hypothetical protein